MSFCNLTNIRLNAPRLKVSAKKAGLKPPQSRRWRDCRTSPNFAQRLDCGAFTGAIPAHNPNDTREPFKLSATKTERVRKTVRYGPRAPFSRACKWLPLMEQIPSRTRGRFGANSWPYSKPSSSRC